MVNYHCPRCGFNTLIKTKYIAHLRRKYICDNIYSDDTLIKEYQKFNIIDKKEDNINIPKHSKNEMLNPIYSNKIIKSINICEFCESIYSTKSNLNKHIKICKHNDNDENMSMKELVKLLNEQMKEQKEQMKEERQILNNQIKEQNSQIKELIKKAGITNSNINIQQNIKLLSYGNTDMSHLTDKDYMKCLNHSNFCVPYLIEQIHFDPKKPENHNIYISNIKNNYVMLYDGKQWILKDRDEAIMNLIDDKDVILEQKLEEWIEKGNEYPKIMSKFKRYIDKKDNNKVLNKIKDEIKLVLFNNRGMIDKKQII